MKQISVGAGGKVWAVNSDNVVFTRPGVYGTWQKIEQRLMMDVDVGVDAPNEDKTLVWGCDLNQQVLARYGVADNWQLIPGLSLVQVAVTVSGRVWGLNSAN